MERGAGTTGAGDVTSRNSEMQYNTPHPGRFKF